MDYIATISLLVAGGAWYASSRSAQAALVSATTAQSAEDRTKEAVRFQAMRDARRSQARILVLSKACRDGVDQARFDIRSGAVAAGQLGGSRERVQIQNVEKYLQTVDEAEDIAKQALPTVADSAAIEAMQLDLDSALVRLEGVSAALQRRLARLDVERLIDGIRLSLRNQRPTGIEGRDDG